MRPGYVERLKSAIEQKGSRVCVGLDPRYGRLPEELRAEVEELTDAPILRYAEGYRRFCRGVIEAVADVAVAVKPQFAFFEAAGPAAQGALIDIIGHAREHGLLIIGDAKRGDIGSTAEAYAQAFLAEHSPYSVDALTVNPYLGRDALEPFAAVAAENQRLIYLLVKTSNPGSADLQDLPLKDDRPLWHAVAELARRLHQAYPGTVGAVFGATHPGDLAPALELLEGLPLLLPGYGAQGADIGDLAPALTSATLVNSSRNVIFAHEKSTLPWRQAVAQAALEMRTDLAAAP